MDASVPYVDGFVLVVGYEADVIGNLVGDEYDGESVEYVTQHEQRGTAHPHAHRAYSALRHLSTFLPRTGCFHPCECEIEFET